MAVMELAWLEDLMDSLGGDAASEAVHNLDAQIEVAKQARRITRDALTTHWIEKRRARLGYGLAGKA